MNKPSRRGAYKHRGQLVLKDVTQPGWFILDIPRDENFKTLRDALNFIDLKQGGYATGKGYPERLRKIRPELPKH